MNPSSWSPASFCGRGKHDRARLGRAARLWAPAALALLVALPLRAGAEAGPDDEDVPVVEGEDVTVTAERPLPRDPAAPTSATTEVRLADRAPVDLDLSGPLSEAPAVVLRRYGGPGSLATVSLRGSAADQVLVRLGGLPLTPPGGGLVDLSALPPFLLSSVAVTRGSEGAAYGAGALGGVVNLEPLDARGEDAVRLQATAGSFGTFAGAASARGRAGPLRLAGGLVLDGTAGDFPYERDLTPNLPDDPWTSQTREANAARSGAGLLAGALPTAAGTLRLTAFGQRGHREVPGMTGFPTPGAESTDWRTLGGLAFEGRPRGARFLKPTARAWVGLDGYDYRPGEAESSVTGPAHRADRLTAGAELAVGALLGSHLPKLVLGAAFERFVATGVAAERPSLTLGISDALYLLGDRLTVHAAARLEAFGDHGAFVTPKLGLAFRAADGLTLDTNLGRGVRLPTLHELHAETALTAANPDLRPERATTLDAGATVHGDRGRLRLGGWWAEYQDLISYELYPPLRLKPVNFRGARVAGLEAEGRWQPWRPLALVGAYAFTHAANRRDDANEAGRRLPYRPPHRGLLRAVLATGPVRTWVEAEGQSAMPRNRANTKELPGRVLLGAGLRWSVHEHLEAALTATNLLDDRRLEDLYGYPLPGRAFLVSARLTLPTGGDDR